MLDEIRCDAALPDVCRYWITASGRFIDSDGNDLEPCGYITFYAYPKDRASGDSSITMTSRSE